MGRSCWHYDDQFRWKWTSRYSRIQNHRCDSSCSHFCQTAQYLRSSSGDVWRISLVCIQKLIGYGETRSAWESGNHGNTTRNVDKKSNFSEWCMSTGKLIAWRRAEIHRSSRTCQIDQTLLQCRSREDAWWRSTWQSERIMSRVHLASKWSIISSERMDPWKHEDRSSSGCDGLLSPRALRCWHQDRIPTWWQNLFLGADREWNQQIRDRNVRRESCCKCWREEYRETCCEGWTTTDIKLDVVSCVCSIPWTKVDRHRPRNIQQQLSGGIEIDCQIAMTWRFNVSRRRRISEIRRPGINVLIEKWGYLALVNSDKDKLLAKRRSKTTTPVLLEPCLTSSSNSRPFWRRSCWSYIARQRTVAKWLHRSHPSRWELSRPDTPSSSLGWFREVSLRNDRHAVFVRAVNPMRVDQHNEFEYDLNNPRVAVCKNTWNTHQNTVYWCNLKVAQKKGLQFYQTRSKAIVLYNTLLAMCIENVVFMKSGEELYNKVCQSPTLPRKGVLTPNLHHGRQDLSNLEARSSADHQRQRSRCNWLGCTASCLVQAENLEETSRHGVFGRHQTCSIERIQVLSIKIERNHPLRHAPLKVVQTPNKPNQRPNIQLLEQGD